MRRWGLPWNASFRRNVSVHDPVRISTPLGEGGGSNTPRPRFFSGDQPMILELPQLAEHVKWGNSKDRFCFVLAEKGRPMSSYDKEYREKPDLFGAQASKLLEEFGSIIKGGGRVLDIGVGQGRNALPLARRGLRVVGVDSSRVSIEHVRDMAQREVLPVETWQGSVFDYAADPEAFDAILVFGLLQILTRERISTLTEKIQSWVAPGGLVFLAAWHTGDPNYERINRHYQALGEHSFKGDDGEIRTFLAPNEVVQLFPAWEVVHHWEGLGPMHRHGDGAPEQHGDVELVVKKPAL